VGAGVSFINLHRSERCRTGFRKCISPGEHAEEAQHSVDIGKGGVRRRTGRVRVDRLPGEINPFPKSLRSPLIGVICGFEEQVISLAVLYGTPGQRSVFFAAQLNRNLFETSLAISSGTSRTWESLRLNFSLQSCDS
jgi:hypothetical protein